MKLVGIELVRVDVPFRHEIGTATLVHRTRSLLYIRVLADEAEGWGECAALGEATSVDPSTDEVAEAARSRGARRLVDASAARGGHLPLEAEVAQLFGSSPVDRQLGAAFEMAVADVELRRAGRSLAASIEVGTGFESMPVGAAVGIPPGHDLGTLRQQVAEVVGQGAARVRLKIAPGWDTEPVAAVRADHPELALQVDANGSYQMEDADRLNELASFGLICLEQPLPPADLVAHAELARRIDVPIALDESLSSPRRVQDALRNQACAVACLKPGRLGGVRAARLAHAACVDAGVSVFVGGFFETGLGRASNLALAARLAQDAVGLVGDLADPATYLEVDPCGYPEVRRGWVRVPDQPGVGPGPDELTLGHLGAHREWFPATYT
ncbi:MAG TPA: enolase C-terminal domain-like protein [Acidimicrobiales bacterium]|jgi:O-succinylbenzoate synthase|nr:enolase C-terminal domain-like protein [Acidimicrobiales bacterium]